ncbi:hypothetical protein ACFW16_21165 [Inquilinus sp. NPDC058860]|uniref:hypothetical protein n=1 Tax=Inquilinus sp. NPDC058860 TaxID=3346652 RepID=UPI00369E564A
MAVVNGTAGNDLIHVAGDGVVAQPGFTDIPQATASNDLLYGLGGNDLIYGGVGFDEIFGGDGNDVIDGGADLDEIFGGDGNDVIHGGAGPDDLDGGEGDDVVYGDDEDDVIYGGNGNDILVGGAGPDTLAGGAGIDTVRYDGTTGVRIDLHRARGYYGDAEGDVIFGVEIVEGTVFGDNVSGAAASETLRGRDGNDTLYGRGGNDALSGDAGNDGLYGDDGDDGLSGGDGDDLLDGGAGADRLAGGAGVDMLRYFSSAAGVAVNLTARTASGGHAQGDVIGADIELVDGSVYADTLTGSAAANTLFGEAGNDSLSGLAGDDSLSGGDGDDVLRGGIGADRLDGGVGIDFVSYYGATARVIVDLAAGAGSGGDAAGDTYFEIENVSGSTAADGIHGNAVANVLNGYEGDDALYGYDGDDTLLGGAGDDFLQGAAGADRIDGGAGIDTIDYNGAAGVTVNLGTGLGSGGEAQGDVISGVENVQGTGDYGDALTGSAAANRLRGYGGNDVLLGLGGSDTLIGDGGDDTLRGGDGDDILHVGPGADIMDGGAGRDTVVFTSATAADWQTGMLSPDIAEDTWEGWEVIQGSSGNDTIRTANAGFAVELRGGAGDDVLAAAVDAAFGDTLWGEDGNDRISGGAGDDTLRGGAGADTLDGGTGIDTASYYNGLVGVSVNLTAGSGSGGDASADTLAGIENVSGSQGNDILVGNADANALRGWGGADVLNGVAGQDTLTGGTGADRFVLSSTAHSPVGGGADLITDFSHAQADKIDLHLIDANTGAGGDQAFSFIGTGAYTGAAGQLRYVVSGGVTTIGGDLNGDKVTDFQIKLTGSIALVAGDFVL